MTVKMSESDSLATATAVKASLVEDMSAVAERVLYPPTERVSCQGTPSATALYAILRYHPLTVRTDDGDVSLISLTEKSASVDVEKTCRIIAHQPHHLRQRQQSFIH